jgi:hypothetical protein
MTMTLYEYIAGKGLSPKLLRLPPLPTGVLAETATQATTILEEN